MTNLQQVWLQRNASVLCIPIVLYILGAVGGQLASVNRVSIFTAWRIARVVSVISLIFALDCFPFAIRHAAALARRPRIDALVQSGAWHLSFRFDLVASLMLLLVSFLGWVIVSYSRSYMAGDPREHSYVAHLMLTLAAVSLIVVTNSLVLFLAAWVFTGLFLHGLLTLYPNRQAAVIAAHKKFLASRLGDLTLLGAVIVLGLRTGSFEIDEVAAQVSTLHPDTVLIHVAAILLAISAIIKCAQIPLHGWLIQVMEAPTPVSALLHAGLVNLGGFMLIRLAPVINTTPAAQQLLVFVGGLTAMIGSLVMTTRISIKVNLAWSTCAQMGFMLMECGLGLYGLAFLHLLAHSLYKAHAFLSSGDAVNQARLKLMTPRYSKIGLPGLLISGVCGILVAACGAVLWRHRSLSGALAFLCVPVVGFALAGLFAAMPLVRSLAGSLILCATAIGVSAIYFGYEILFQSILPIATVDQASQRAMLIFSLMCFGLLWAVQIIIRVQPMGQIATALYPWFYAGFYLDELVTRTTFRIWPANRISKVAPRRDATQPFDGSGVNP